MEIEIKTIYTFDDVDTWGKEEKDIIFEFQEIKKNGMDSAYIDSIVSDDHFPVFVKKISGSIINFSSSWVEYEIVRDVECTQEEYQKIEKWNKKCSDSKIEKVEK